MNQRLQISLLSLRMSVFVVMLAWTLDKFFRPDHAASVFDGFYGLSNIGSSLMKATGLAELILLLGFILGIKKRLTYGTVFLLHGISTLSSYKQYLAPFEKVNLLFFAAWPMLAACFVLYLWRDEDTLYTFGR